MNRLFLTVLFFLNATICFSQNWKDTLLLKMPMVEGRLVYGDSIKINGKNKTSLDSIAKKWFETYYKYHRPDTLSKDNDANSCILSQGAVEFKISTSSLALVKYDFFFNNDR